MARLYSTYAAAVALVVFAAACDDGTPPSAPQDGPSFAKAPTFACTFNGNPSLSGAINDYFTVASEKTTANGYASALQTAYNTAPAPNYTLAEAAGFDLLKYVGTVARLGHGASPAKGELVIEQTIQCMYDVAAASGIGGAFEGWPTATQFDFASALSFDLGGAYFVRGGSGDSSDPVVAYYAWPTATTAADSNVSAIAPAASSSWSASLGKRVLIYGNLYSTVPGDPAIGYDWKFIPRNATFNPNGVVALCPGLGINFGNTDMVNQLGLGVLAYQDATSLCSSKVVALQGRSLLQRMSQFARSTFMPEAAHASALLTSTGGGLGGAKGDPFVSVPVNSLVLEFVSVPSVMRVNQPSTVVARASVLVDGVKTYVNGACLVITGTNNNGQGTALNGSKECSTSDLSSIQVSQVTTFRTPPKTDPGYATFVINPTKTGGLTLTLSATILVTKNQSVMSNTVTAKTNVKP